VPLLSDLRFFAEVDILVGLVFAAALIVLDADWRIALYALAAQYVLTTLLLSLIIQPSIAILRVISGALAAIILYITFRRLTEERRAAFTKLDGEPPADWIARLYQPEVFVVGYPFRLIALAFVAVGIIGVASSMTFLGLAPDVLFGGVWLIAAGILVAILSRDVLRLGLGILLFTSGFAILESGTEGSLFLYGLLNISDLLLAVVVAHLATVTQQEIGPARRRGETP
jgi:hypothetical protein